MPTTITLKNLPDDVYERLKQQWPQLRLVIAPRYVERARGIAAQYNLSLIHI